MSEGEWKIIRHGKGGKRRAKRARKGSNASRFAVHHKNAPLAPDLFSDVNIDHVMKVANSLRSSVWWQQTAAHVRQATESHASCQATLYCLGLGSFTRWNNSTHQLACACLLRELLHVSQCFVGDPCMSSADELLLEQLQMTRKEWQPKEDLVVDHGTFLFVLLPHCAREINEQVLRALKRGGALDKAVFLANQLSLYRERLPALSEDHGGFIGELHESGRLQERACPCSKLSSSETAFNDLCVMTVLPEGSASGVGGALKQNE